MNPGNFDIVIYQGTTLYQLIQWKSPDGSVVDLNQYTARLQARSDVGLVFELTTENDGIVPQGDGTARLYIDDNSTRVLPEGNYKYDLLVRAKVNGLVDVLLKGRVRVLPLVTDQEPSE